MSKWLTHLKQFYNDKKKTIKDYSYKQAMVDASRTFKRSVSKRFTRNKSSNKKKTRHAR